MKYTNLKDAFGSTPESVGECVKRSLQEGERRKSVMARKMSVSLAIALAVMMLIGCMALAATQLDGIAGVFSRPSLVTGEQTIDESIVKAIQPLAETYEGNSVRLTMNEALYDSTTDTTTLAWTLEPLAEDSQLYVYCEGIRVNGELARYFVTQHINPFVLSEAVDGIALFETPKAENTEIELIFHILKTDAEFVRVSGWDDENEAEEEFWQRLEAMIKEGKLPMGGDGWIEVRWPRDTSYVDALLNTGLMELADSFTLPFSVDQLQSAEPLTYAGETSFLFDGYEIRINELLLSPISLHLEAACIIDEDPRGHIAALSINPSIPGMEFGGIFGNGIDESWTQTEDGRWMSVYTFDSTGMDAYPHELLLTLTTYSSGQAAVRHTDDAITLSVSDFTAE